MNLPKVLIIEDDQDISALIEYHLKRDGYDTRCLYDGADAMDFISAQNPNLIILDVMLPGMDGLEICRLLKADKKLSHIPVLMLTAKSEESDVLVGLQLGADDYITKPFSPKVLLARVKTILRRLKEFNEIHHTNDQRCCGDLVIDVLKHKVVVRGMPVVLTAIEFNILEFLSRSPGRAFSREQILDGVWTEGKFIMDRAVDVHMLALRKKLGNMGHVLETVRGFGYRFREYD